MDISSAYPQHYRTTFREGHNFLKTSCIDLKILLGSRDIPQALQSGVVSSMYPNQYSKLAFYLWKKCIKEPKKAGKTPDTSCFDWINWHDYDGLIHTSSALSPPTTSYVSTSVSTTLATSVVRTTTPEKHMAYTYLIGGTREEVTIYCFCRDSPVPFQVAQLENSDKGVWGLERCYRRWDLCAGDLEVFRQHSEEDDW
ncbi:hypothetical protein P171DRAFT_500861 [Karstenula rhodostoma CBS 690.94]|uniref:Uncharacterized protein n=1 Tax=Karstenula rhodostoma CBS 690.94 TaxID=1392251 RepID=A0A9P4P9Z5_9PLEO|nr:hypothetical protein P171DRAFT_500861 [Karstenula rhodostoma CBS 690.94]